MNVIQNSRTRSGSWLWPAGRTVFLLLPLLAFFFVVPAYAQSYGYAGTFGSKEAIGPGKQTRTVGDPIYTSGGEFRQQWPLLSLGGMIPLNFTLIYAPDLGNVMPMTNGRYQLPPSIRNSFLTNTMLRIVEFEDRTVTPSQGYINALLVEELLIFRESAPGIFQVLNPVKYQLKKVGEYYFLMDPLSQLVYIFRSRTFDVAMQTSTQNQRFRRVGEVAAIMDRKQNRLSFEYGDAQTNNPTRIEDGLGRRLDLSYAQSNDVGKRHLQRVTDGYGRSITFQFQTRTCASLTEDALASFTDALGQTTSFQYFPNVCHASLAERIVPPGGSFQQQQSWGQNPYGSFMVFSQRDALGNQTQLNVGSSDGSNRSATTISRPDGTQQMHRYQNYRYPLAAVDETGKTATFELNNDQQTISMVDRENGRTEFGYHTPSGMLSSFKNAMGGTTTIGYGSQDQTFTAPNTTTSATFTFYFPTRVDYPNSVSEQMTYDERGNVTSFTDREGQVWRYTYDTRGLLLTVVNPAGGTVTMTYNADATLASVSDPETGAITYAYDTYKRPIRTGFPDGTTYQIGYDLADRIISITDERGQVTRSFYDVNGNLVRLVDAAGREMLVTYDVLDRPEKRIDRNRKAFSYSYDTSGRLTGITDPTGVSSSWAFDPRGWPDRFAGASKTWRISYDAEGLPLSVTSPLGYTNTYRTNSMGKTVEWTDPEGNRTLAVRDVIQRITSVTDPLNRITALEYTNRDRIASIALPTLEKTRYQYNSLGKLAQIADPRGGIWNFAYSPMGRMLSATDPLGRTRTFNYDARGRLSQQSLPDGGTRQNSYDGSGHLLRQLCSGGPDLKFSYDVLGQLIGANDIDMAYDAEGRITQTRDSDGFSFDAGYDDAGRLKTAGYNTGAFMVNYAYDAQTGQLREISDSLTGVRVTLSRDEDLRIIGMVRSNRVNGAWTWDRASRLTRIQEGNFMDHQRNYDAAGQVTQVTTKSPIDPEFSFAKGSLVLSYDAAQQVNTAGYGYDARGRLTTMPGHTFRWDGADRLIGMDTVVLAYNGLGQLRIRQQGGTTTHYYTNHAISMAPIVAERNDTLGRFQRFYIWTPDGKLLYMIDAANGNRVYFYHFDHTGSTVALTDSAGTLTDAYAYAPDGTLLAHNGSASQPFTFNGQFGIRQEDAEGTLYQMRARYYHTLTARFLSLEPLWPDTSDPQRLNPYQFAKNNPVSYIDPDGTNTLKPLLKVPEPEFILFPPRPPDLPPGQWWDGKPMIWNASEREAIEKANEAIMRANQEALLGKNAAGKTVKEMVKESERFFEKSLLTKAGGWASRWAGPIGFGIEFTWELMNFALGPVVDAMKEVKARDLEAAKRAHEAIDLGFKNALWKEFQGKFDEFRGRGLGIRESAKKAIDWLKKLLQSQGMDWVLDKKNNESVNLEQLFEPYLRYLERTFRK